MTATPSPRPALRAVTAATLLVLAAGAASGQSMEYRRGYDEGYRDGLNAARSGAGDSYGSRGPRVRIDRATYGVGNAYCDARPALESRLPGPPATVIADNQLCGDPAPGTLKSLVVQYRCSNFGQALRMQFPENTPVILDCR